MEGRRDENYNMHGESNIHALCIIIQTISVNLQIMASQKDCNSMTFAMKETRYASWVGMAVVPRLQHLTALLRLQSKFCAPSMFQ